MLQARSKSPSTQLAHELPNGIKLKPVFRRFDSDRVVYWERIVWSWSWFGLVNWKGELVVRHLYWGRLYELVFCFHAGIVKGRVGQIPGNPKFSFRGVPLTQPQPTGSVYCGLFARLCRNLLGLVE